jgi:hypothetical protein
LSQISHITSPRPFARLGANHGYSIDGDIAQLHADVEVLGNPPLVGDWALQLWACDSPHAGGPLSGVKVAEAALARHPQFDDRRTRLDGETHARVPGGQRDYAMVLVLASGEGGHFNQVHDFANYPARQRFITPHLEGSVGYQLEGEFVVLTAEGIHNPRGPENLSGSLSLELWALTASYDGGAFDGHALGRLDLGRLAGQCSIPAVVAQVPFSPPPTGDWDVVMMLREWAGPIGYVTRDHARFAVPYLVGEATAVNSANAEGIVALPVMDSPSPNDGIVSTETAEVVDAVTPEPVSTRVTESTSVSLPWPSAPVPVKARAEAEPPARLSVNNASAAQLAAVKGLSRKVASEIVKRRPYASIEDLLDVRGIGPKLLDKLRPYLAL